MAEREPSCRIEGVESFPGSIAGNVYDVSTSHEQATPAIGALGGHLQYRHRGQS